VVYRARDEKLGPKSPLRCCGAAWWQVMKLEDGFGARPRLSQK
jgi:hypothetical protein